MGPLIPNELINPQWNFVIALIIGMAFGFVLEASGFSSSRKLVGVFYGYDFVVLKVFMTAATTAMIGLFYFNYMGWIDMSMIYINPTFLYAAIVGGAIMGLGFIIGGFCPGTSTCAAAIGKIDAWVYMIGMFIGIFIFAQGYPLIEGLYKKADLGDVRVFESLGVTENLMIFAMIIITLGSFFVAYLVKRKVKPVDY